AAHFNKHLRAAGILKGDSKYYISTAHTPDDVAKTLDAFAAGIKAL
ncbi:MAG: Glutamate-semialdehyde -aminomutase, partial [Rubritepida sp.]|nr:Glutamate-semialdehyde -aminomutase [Rubritepida sp.]